MNNELKRQAVACGLCEEFTNEWCESLDKQGLIDMWLRDIDFGIKHDYPSNEFIKRHFEEEMLEANGVFVDRGGLDLSNCGGKVMLCGACTGRLSFDGYAACNLYVRHGCEVRVDAGGSAKVFVNVYGDASVDVRQREEACVYVYLHGSDYRLRYEGEVLVRKSKE